VGAAGRGLRVSGEPGGGRPRIYTGLHVRYVFRGKDLPMDRLERAVKLSEETYCGVSAMLRPAVPITTEIVIAP